MPSIHGTQCFTVQSGCRQQITKSLCIAASMLVRVSPLTSNNIFHFPGTLPLTLLMDKLVVHKLFSVLQCSLFSKQD